jgi:hypothetical protein
MTQHERIEKRNRFAQKIENNLGGDQLLVVVPEVSSITNGQENSTTSKSQWYLREA